MEESTGYHLLASKLMRDIVNHGWGEMTFRVNSLKDRNVRIEIVCGLSHHFFVKKEIFYEKDIL